MNKHHMIRCQRLPRILTFRVLNIFIWKIKIYRKFIIPPQWHGTGSWNPSSCNTITYLFYIVNNMGADLLVSQAARASKTWYWPAMLNRNDSVTARWWLMCSWPGTTALTTTANTIPKHETHLQDIVEYINLIQMGSMVTCLIQYLEKGTYQDIICSIM